MTKETKTGSARTVTPQYASRKSFEAAQRRAIIKLGLEPIRAKYDAAGNCLTCGEAGRCPGYHAAAEATMTADAQGRLSFKVTEQRAAAQPVKPQQHTPGNKWRVTGSEVLSEDDARIAYQVRIIAPSRDLLTPSQLEGLIAAAPDMKKELDEAAHAMEWIAARLKDPSGDDLETSIAQLEARARVVRAAIAKAEGR